MLNSSLFKLAAPEFKDRLEREYLRRGAASATTMKTRSSSKSTTTSDSSNPAAGTGASLGTTSTSCKRMRSSTRSKSSDSAVQDVIEDIFEDEELSAYGSGRCLFHALPIGEGTAEPGAEVGMAMREETLKWLQRLENELKLMEWMDWGTKEAVLERLLPGKRLPTREEREALLLTGWGRTFGVMKRSIRSPRSSCADMSQSLLPTPARIKRAAASSRLDSSHLDANLS